MPPKDNTLLIEVTTGVSNLDPDAWNQLVGDGSPFLEHGFLANLERTECTGPHAGWYPQIITCSSDGKLVGALPLYIKTNSRGEFVFDWAWADAAQRAGIPYYPKACVAIPFTPVTGARLLARPDLPAPEQQRIQKRLVQAAIQHAEELNLSSIHFNFIPKNEVTIFEQLNLPIRTGVQYHWSNNTPDAPYKHFDDYLQRFRSKRRANIRRERKKLAEKGVTTRVVHGHEATPELMRNMFRYYKNTVDQFHWGKLYLNVDFFLQSLIRFPQNVQLVIASQDGIDFAGAFNLIKNGHLYGRYWGCDKHVAFTHFEVCLYTPIQWCIENNVHTFEPGAGGEHKHDRGFEAKRTYSAHFIAQPDLKDAIHNFLDQESAAIDHHVDELNRHGPFKTPTEPKA